MHKKLMNISNVRTMICLMSIAILILSLIPLFMMAKYNYQFGDDTLFSDSIIQAREADPSLKTTLRAAVSVVFETRERWQGTYSAIFLMALQPGVFGAEAYGVTPYIMIGSLILSTGLLLYTLLIRILKTDRKTWLIITAWLSLLSIQLSVSAREAFFWYNGAVYYTFYYSLVITLLALVLNLFLVRRVWQKIVLAVIGVLLAFFIAGGNYATVMICGELLVLALVYAAATRKRASLYAIAAMLLVFGVGLWISVSAPGNALRQSDVISSGYAPLGPFKAIAMSLAFGAYFGLEWLDISCFALAVATVFAVRPAIQKMRFNFSYPLLVILLSFGIFASQFTPSAYAASSPGPYRLRNVAYFTFLLLVLFDSVYVAGWFIKKRSTVKQPSLSRLSEMIPVGRYCILISVLFLLLVGAGFVQRGVVSLPSAVAVIELRNGTAQTHAQKRLSEIYDTEFNQTDFVDSQLLS